MEKLKKVWCVNCGREFFRSDGRMPRGRAEGIRSRNCRTCSKRCSREYYYSHKRYILTSSTS